MNTCILDTKNSDSACFDFFESTNASNIVTILIDGFPRNRLILKPLMIELAKSIRNSNFASVSFTGSETDKSCSPKTQYKDLKQIILDIIDRKKINKINLVCTSMGSISSVLVLIDKELNKHIKNVLFLDPADYILDMDSEKEGKTWGGSEKYDTESRTLSLLLNKITSNAKVSVVNFTIRNCIGGQYVPNNERGMDHPGGHTRLNNEMVKSFYKRTPVKNQGFYIEDADLPHAFLRDGNIKQNMERIINYISKITT